jgi:hypothetical protein
MEGVSSARQGAVLLTMEHLRRSGNAQAFA